MRFLLYSAIFLVGCSSAYQTLSPVAIDQSCIDRLKPLPLETAWFNAAVDVMGKHISGLLLIKQMPDSLTRIVFTNEGGITFFDFEFQVDGTFQVKQMMKQLNRKPVVNTLRNDFSLLLGIPFRKGEYKAWYADEEIYYGVKSQNETAYFVTDKNCTSLRRLELASKRKPMMTIFMEGDNRLSPERILIRHHAFDMTINLKKLKLE